MKIGQTAGGISTFKVPGITVNLVYFMRRGDTILNVIGTPFAWTTFIVLARKQNSFGHGTGSGQENHLWCPERIVFYACRYLVVK